MTASAGKQHLTDTSSAKQSFDDAVKEASKEGGPQTDMRSCELVEGDHILPRTGSDGNPEIPECFFVGLFEHQPSDGNVWLKVRTRTARNVLIVHEDDCLAVNTRVIGEEPGWPRPYRPYAQIDLISQKVVSVVSLPVPLGILVRGRAAILERVRRRQGGYHIRQRAMQYLWTVT